MSCNGCRILRKGCSNTCVLRSCLHWIDSPIAQANAVLFLAKFFGRSDLIYFISAVPESQRPALFRSLLFEACGRTVNPVDGAVGLMSRGNWHVCQVAVETVLAGGNLQPITAETSSSPSSVPSTTLHVVKEDGPSSDHLTLSLAPKFPNNVAAQGGRRDNFPSVEQLMMKLLNSAEESEMTSFGSRDDDRKLLNLFV